MKGPGQGEQRFEEGRGQESLWGLGPGGGWEGAGSQQTLGCGCREQVVGRVDDKAVSVKVAPGAGTLAGARPWRRTATELWLGFHG